MTEAHWSSGLTELRDLPIKCIDEVDLGGSYDFDAVAIVQDAAGKFYVVSSGGCSCPTHEDNAQFDAGPFDSYSEALLQIPETHRSQFKQELP